MGMGFSLRNTATMEKLSSYFIYFFFNTAELFISSNPVNSFLPLETVTNFRCITLRPDFQKNEVFIT